MPQARFALVELCALPIPPEWPQFGIELTAGWVRRGWQGAIAHTHLLEESPGLWAYSRWLGDPVRALCQ
jgi:hypothetical protein